MRTTRFGAARRNFRDLRRASIIASLCTAAALLGAATVAAQTPPNLGPNVYIVTPSMSQASVQSTLQSLANAAQFDTARTAVLFMPGSYDVQSDVGYYESIAGLGETPNAVAINGFLTSNQTDSNGNLTTNFWRSVENMAITSPTTLQWGVSQGAPFRRMVVNGPLELANTNCGYASGGFISDSLITGQVNPCSQQQWYTRNSSLGSWSGGVWNMVFSGVQGAPAQSFPNPPETVLASTPASREKPFLYVDSNGNWFVFVPTLRTNSSGVSWTNSSLGTGYSAPITTFFIAQPSTSLDAINNALAAGQNLILTPGIYQYSGSINISNPNTVVLGLGFATVVPQSGTAAITVADVDGVQIAGLIIDAGPVNSPVLLQLGTPGAVRASHQTNPTSISDIFFRIGGATLGSASTTMEVDSDNVIIDDSWLWRADHGSNAADIGWTENVGINGLIVNADNVTALGLFVEHYEQTQVQWNGNGGETIFYQSELPYDVPSQSVWMDGSADGYPSYNVASNVITHQAYGLGVYSYFDLGFNIVENSAITVPVTPGVSVTDAVSVWLGGTGSISYTVNSAGSSVSSWSTGTNPSYVSLVGDQPCTANCPTVPTAPGGLKASAISSSQINLSWTSVPAVVYDVFASTMSGFAPSASNQVGSGISGTVFAATGLTAATTYYFVVEATNAAGISSPSAQASALTLSGSTCGALPGTPIAPVVEGVSSTQNSIYWAASNTPANCSTTYTVYRSLSSSGSPIPGEQIATGLTFTSYLDSGLTKPGSYYYAIVAVDQQGVSAPTSWTGSMSLSSWTQVWADPFNEGPAGTFPSATYWTPDVVNNMGQNPFGDGTIQSTTASTQNAYLDGKGDLVVAMTYNAPANTYASARLISASPIGPYGRVDARIMNPYATGMGAAFWALGSNYFLSATPWPQCGELDIMESQSLNPGHTGSTIHGFETDSQTGYEYNGLSEGVTLPNGEQLQQAFHIYSVRWKPYHFEYFLDGVQYGDEQLNDIGSTDIWELNNSINFILSSGVGGNGGTPNGMGFPANLTFNYIRYYRWAAGAPSPVGGVTAAAPYSNAVNLSWTASATQNVTYDIYASTTPGAPISTSNLVAQQITGTAFQHTGLQPNTIYYYTVVAANWGGESTSATASVTTRPPGHSTGMHLSAGGYSVGTYMNSSFVVGGNTNFHLNNVINTAQVSNPAPQKVYDTERWGAAAWTVTGLNPGAGYNIILHFVEQTHTGPGQRQFNVSINSAQVLTNFDIFATAGAANTAIAEQFFTDADENGIIEIQTNFGRSGVSDLNPTINAIEIVPATGSNPVGASPGTTTDLAIDSGGGVVNNFVADEEYNGGDVSTTTNAVTVTGVPNAAPEAVYDSQRYVPFTYILNGLVGQATYRLNLHFAETYWTATGQRTFGVAVNGASILSNLDVYALAGANKALVEQLTANADRYGQIIVQLLAGSADNPFINGIEAVQLNEPVGAPTGLAAKVATGTVDLAWTASSTPGVTYSIYRGIPGVSPTLLMSGINTESYGDKSVTAGVSYDYYVIATLGAGVSPQSNWVNALP